MFDDPEPRNTSGLSLGTKITIIAAIPFLLFGLYFLFAPITELRTTTGSVFGCGTAISPPSDTWRASICQEINQTYMFRGIAGIATGILMIGGGFFLFGNRHTDDDSGADDSDPGTIGRSFD